MATDKDDMEFAHSLVKHCDNLKHVCYGKACPLKNTACVGYTNPYRFYMDMSPTKRREVREMMDKWRKKHEAGNQTE